MLAISGNCSTWRLLFEAIFGKNVHQLSHSCFHLLSNWNNLLQFKLFMLFKTPLTTALWRHECDTYPPVRANQGDIAISDKAAARRHHQFQKYIMSISTFPREFIYRNLVTIFSSVFQRQNNIICGRAPYNIGHFVILPDFGATRLKYAPRVSLLLCTVHHNCPSFWRDNYVFITLCVCRVLPMYLSTSASAQNQQYYLCF